MVMTVGASGGSASEAWTIEVGGLSLVRNVTQRANRAGTGSTSVTVHGVGLGLVMYTGEGRAGQTGCEATEWESQTAVRCQVGAGARGSRRAVVTAGHRVGSLSRALSLDTSVLSQVSSGNRAGTGSASVTIQGMGLGATMLTLQARAGETGCESSGWKSDTSVQCKVSHGVRGTRRAVLTLGETYRSLSGAWSVDIGVTGLRLANSTNNTLSNHPGTGSLYITVRGADMGLAAMTMKSRGGGTGCEATDWEAETSVRCLASHGTKGRIDWP